MGFSNDVFDERTKIEDNLEKMHKDIFNNWVYCEHAEYCGGMKERLSRSPIKNQERCSRNPGRKLCEWYIAFESGCLKKIG